MRRLNVLHTAIVKKCNEGDAKPGRPWCIYKHNQQTGDQLSPQPKGWPKTYKTQEDAKNGLRNMKIFGK